jgi:hypothetical protein
MFELMGRVLRPFRELYRFWCLGIAERNIVFYSESGQDYHFFANILSHITEDFGKQVCYLTSDEDDQVFGTDNPKVLPFYIGKGLSRTILFHTVDANVLVLTMLELHNHHLKRSKCDVHYVLVPHSMVSTHMVDRANAFDNYDTICCVGPHHQHEIRRREELFSLQAKNLLPCGYDRFDVLWSERDAARTEVNAKGTSVLIAPSWGDQGLLESCGKELIENLLVHHFHVVLRPHPQTIRLNPTLIDELLELFGDHERFVYDRDMGATESLLAADAMVSDWSGAALELGLALEKPVLFVDVPPKMKNPDYERLGITPVEMALRDKLGHVVRPEDVHLSAELIEGMMLEINRPDYDVLRDEVLFNIGNGASVTARGIAAIADRRSNRS